MPPNEREYKAVAQERDGNGLFTRAILDAFGGGADRNGDDVVQVEELLGFVDEKVRERSGGKQQPTIPRIEGGRNFPLFRVEKK